MNSSIENTNNDRLSLYIYELLIMYLVVARILFREIFLNRRYSFLTICTDIQQDHVPALKFSFAP